MNFVIRAPELSDELLIKEYIVSMLNEPFRSPGDCGFLNYDTYKEWLDTMKRSEQSSCGSWCFAKAKEFIVVDTDEDEIAGMMNMRLEMNDVVRNNIGHISLSVTKPYRRIGLATSMIDYAKELYRELGVNEVVLLCSKDNKASKSLIESINGKFVDKVKTMTDDLLRYIITI